MTKKKASKKKVRLPVKTDVVVTADKIADEIDEYLAEALDGLHEHLMVLVRDSLGELEVSCKKRLTDEVLLALAKKFG